MKEISESEARRYIVSGLAGYWSIHHRTVPIEHTSLFVLRLRGKCWLVDAIEDKFKVEFIGYAGVIAGREKGTFSIECDNEQIQEMAYAEMKERGVQYSPEGVKQVVERN